MRCAGLLSVLLGVCGLRVKTRCGGYLFASFSVVILIAYLVGMVLGACLLFPAAVFDRVVAMANCEHTQRATLICFVV